MNILYKYCNREGAVKIIETLELKLPYISQVNDPLECMPVLYCPEDKAAIEARYLAALKRRDMLPSHDYKQILYEQFRRGEIQKKLINGQRKVQEKGNQQNCLLSVSRNAQETVMWAHYTEIHKGAVIGIDFNTIFPKNGIKMHRVKYSKHRPTINILNEPEGSASLEAFEAAVTTKSVSWKYEKEYRTIFSVGSLEKFQRQGLICFKEIKGRKTWFLRLNPRSIRKVIFGLYTEDSLKGKIRELIKQPELQHVKICHIEESETYKFDMTEED